MGHLIDLILHVDRYLLELVSSYGGWIYGILFAVVFAETGLVVAPILPGDSLLFAAGAIAATGALDIRLVLVLLLVAASTPDSVRTELQRMGYTLETEERTSGPINAILFDRAHGTMWGGSSNHGEDYGIAW